MGGADNDGCAVMSAGCNGVPESKFDTGLLQFITKQRTTKHYKHIRGNNTVHLWQTEPYGHTDDSDDAYHD